MQEFTAVRGDLLSERFGLLDERFALNEQRLSTNEARFGMLEERGGLLGQEGALLGQRALNNAQRFGLVDVEEQARMLSASNQFRRNNVNLNMRRDQALLAHEASGIDLFAQDQAAAQQFRQQFIALAGQRFDEQLGYDEESMNSWYQYMAAKDVFDRAELEQFRARSADEYNLNTRLAGLYHTMNGAGLQAATGAQIVMSGNTAALMGYMGAAGGALDVAGTIYDILKRRDEE